MTSDLVTIRQIHNPLELTERDREAAQAVASGLRDAKADNTRRAYASAWLRFQAWAEAGGHPALPASPQAVALYLGHLAASGRSIAAIQLARSAISHFHAAAGMQKDDNPARHPVVAEGRQGLAQPGPGPRQADALTADALARVREALRLPRRGRGGRMESAETAQRRAALDLAIIGVLADGGLRRSEAADLTWGDVELWPDGTGRLTVQKGKNMRRPAWTQLREMLWPGDVVVVPRIDRLAGNLAEGIRTVQYLHDQGIYIRALPKGLDTGDDNPTSKLMLHMLLSLAEWERETIWGRIQAGVDRAAAEGRTGGRPPALDSEKTQAVKDFLEGSRSVSAAARAFNVSRATIRAVRDWTCTRRTGEANVDRR